MFIEIILTNCFGTHERFDFFQSKFISHYCTSVADKVVRIPHQYPSQLPPAQHAGMLADEITDPLTFALIFLV